VWEHSDRSNSIGRGKTREECCKVKCSSHQREHCTESNSLPRDHSEKEKLSSSNPWGKMLGPGCTRQCTTDSWLWDKLSSTEHRQHLGVALLRNSNQMDRTQGLRVCKWLCTTNLCILGRFHRTDRASHQVLAWEWQLHRMSSTEVGNIGGCS